jgi:hypothetical protein
VENPLIITAGSSLDNVLEAAGRDKLFIPILGEGSKKIFFAKLESNKINSENVTLAEPEKTSLKAAIELSHKLNDNDKNLY